MYDINSVGYAVVYRRVAMLEQTERHLSTSKMIQANNYISLSARHSPRSTTLTLYLHWFTLSSDEYSCVALVNIFPSISLNRPSAFLLPSHLYGELAKTERGCNLLRQHGDLKSLLHTLRNSSSSTDVRRGALWALVGANIVIVRRSWRPK